PGFRGAAMMRSTSLTSVLLPLLLAGALSLGPGHAQEVRTVIGTSAAERYAAEVVELSRLQRAGDPASKIELARRLLQGTLISATNPLPRVDLERAEALADEVIALNDPAFQQRALSLKADVLARLDTPAALAERDEIRTMLARQGYAPVI